MDDEPLEIRVIRRFINASGEKRVIFRSTGLYEWNAQDQSDTPPEPAKVVNLKDYTNSLKKK
jgi:hypothetical protein